MSDTGDIVVKGGSVEVIFDTNVFAKDNGDRKLHKHYGRQITRILVTDQSGNVEYDSAETKKSVGKHIVRISTESK